MYIYHKHTKHTARCAKAASPAALLFPLAAITPVAVALNGVRHSRR